MKKLLIKTIVIAVILGALWWVIGEWVIGLAAVVGSWLIKSNLDKKAKELDEKSKAKSPTDLARDTERLISRGNKRAGRS